MLAVQQFEAIFAVLYSRDISLVVALGIGTRGNYPQEQEFNFAA